MPETGKVLQKRFLDVITEAADGQTHPLSPKRACASIEAHSSCLDQGREIPLDAKQRA